MASIVKRGKSFTIRVSDGYKADGTKILHSKTWTPPAGMTAKQAQKEVQKVALQFEDEVKSGMASNEPALTFEKFIPTYLDIKKNSIAPRTLHQYETVLNDFILPEIGHIKLSKLRPIHIQNFIQKLQETSCQKKYVNGKLITTNKKRSPATVRRYLAIIQSVCAVAVKMDIIPTNPASADKLILPKMVTPETDIFTKQEAEKMLECLEKEPLQFQVLIQLAIMTGCRRGELVALQFSDIDFNTCKVTISKSATKVPGEPIMTKPPKDFQTRAVTVPAYCIDLIKQLQEEKQAEMKKLGTAWHNENWLFTTYDGHIMNIDTPSYWFSDFLKRNGFKHHKFHALRHTSATLLLYGGINIKAVSGRLGHADISTTNHYLHCIAEADETSADVLQEMLITHSKNDEKIKQA